VPPPIDKFKYLCDADHAITSLHLIITPSKRNQSAGGHATNSAFVIKNQKTALLFRSPGEIKERERPLNLGRVEMLHK